MSPVRRHLSMGDFPVDRRLSSNDGWLKMDVQWLVTNESCGSRFCTVGHTIFHPASSDKSSMHDLHTHPDAEEIIIVLRGTGRAISGDEEFPIGPGSVIFVPVGDRHLVENTSETEDMEVIFTYGGATSLSRAGYERMEPQGKK